MILEEMINTLSTLMCKARKIRNTRISGSEELASAVKEMRSQASEKEKILEELDSLHQKLTEDV